MKYSVEDTEMTNSAANLVQLNYSVEDATDIGLTKPKPDFLMGFLSCGNCGSEDAIDSGDEHDEDEQPYCCQETMGFCTSFESAICRRDRLKPLISSPYKSPSYFCFPWCVYELKKEGYNTSQRTTRVSILTSERGKVNLIVNSKVNPLACYIQAAKGAAVCSAMLYQLSPFSDDVPPIFAFTSIGPEWGVFICFPEEDDNGYIQYVSILPILRSQCLFLVLYTFFETCIK